MKLVLQVLFNLECRDKWIHQNAPTKKERKRNYGLKEITYETFMEQLIATLNILRIVKSNQSSGEKNERNKIKLASSLCQRTNNGFVQNINRKIEETITKGKQRFTWFSLRLTSTGDIKNVLLRK